MPKFQPEPVQVNRLSLLDAVLRVRSAEQAAYQLSLQAYPAALEKAQAERQRMLQELTRALEDGDEIVGEDYYFPALPRPIIPPAPIHDALIERLEASEAEVVDIPSDQLYYYIGSLRRN